MYGNAADLLGLRSDMLMGVSSRRPRPRALVQSGDVRGD